MKHITVWIIGDQLLKQHPALKLAEARVGRDNVRVMLVESKRRLHHRPYQRKKLVLLLSAMRHYADALRQRGYTVDYRQSATFVDAIRDHIEAYTPDTLYTMASASYGGRQGQLQLRESLDIQVEIIPNTQFLVGRFNPIPDPLPDKRYVMESFYREMRRNFNVLMDDGEPVGGVWNYDKENRKKLPTTDTPPPDSAFEPDWITRAVMEEVATLPDGVGSVTGFAYAVTHEQAQMAFERFVQERFVKFGPYEDALSGRSHSVYHSVLSPYLNIGLLEPMALIHRAEQEARSGNVPLNSAEGFIRQILGWREFMYWQYWRQMPGMTAKNAWDAHGELPEFVWTGKTPMRCVGHAIKRALDTGYNHHIERLMVLSNLFMLAGVDPSAVNAWFLSVYIDAYEWVMPPNVIGMSLNADGGLTATKPYIASANYINKMGDLCAGCRYNPKQRHGNDACPFNYLYWNFVLQHEERLRGNPRTSRLTWGLRHLDAADRDAVQRDATALLASWQADT
ncbi:MAG: cryptochrome/photolyase family protein [Anaerolineae bacterium]|nr:cryptochrome/photolyase family protein [Anaerolineae bacterium]